MIRDTLSGLALAAALGLALPAAAHHSAAMYDHNKTVNLTGVVKEWDFVQPHTYLEIVAQDDAGKAVVWGFESAGSSAVERAGVKRNTFKPGDKVVVATHPLKDGRPGGSIITVTTADGKVYNPAAAFAGG